MTRPTNEDVVQSVLHLELTIPYPFTLAARIVGALNREHQLLPQFPYPPEVVEQIARIIHGPGPISCRNCRNVAVNILKRLSGEVGTP